MFNVPAKDSSTSLAEEREQFQIERLLQAHSGASGGSPRVKVAGPPWSLYDGISTR
jgi:hypothetical protein